MKNKNLVVILSHCDNKKKLKVLEDNIKKIKSNGFDILLTTHTPLPQDIQSQVEYLIYDKSNPILHWPQRGMTYWKCLPYGSQSLKLVNILPDYGWTAFNQLLTSSHLGLSLDYTHYTFINYDIILTPLLIETLKLPQDFVTSKVYAKENEKGFRFPSFMFNILSKENLKKLLPLISKEQYINGSITTEHHDFKDAETYLGHLISVFNYEVYPEVVKDQIIYIDFQDALNLNKDNDLFKLFYQSITDSKTIHSILIYDIQGELKVNFNGEEILITEPVHLFEDVHLNGINEFGYYLNGSYIDLICLFKEKRTTFINTND
tara:strand:+ start:72 stop:1028 length:957 start_codon:yes stop_codon:yes gene_type:complete